MKGELLEKYGVTKVYGNKMWYVYNVLDSVVCEDGVLRQAYSSGESGFRVKIGEIWHYGEITRNEDPSVGPKGFYFKGYDMVIKKISYPYEVENRIKWHIKRGTQARFSTGVKLAASVISTIVRCPVELVLDSRKVRVSRTIRHKTKVFEYEMPQWLYDWIVLMEHNISRGDCFTYRHAMYCIQPFTLSFPS